MPSSSSVLQPGSILENRYQIVRQLGRGGFGRTYLAEDTNRFREQCLLKEFAPQARRPKELEKAQELFEREAGMLYKLKHPQIPEFRAVLRVSLESRESLFLVQDYVEGKTYFELLNEGKRFNEAEATKLLIDILPVLDYIHSLNLIHRDISPDNLIQQSFDGKPVLIDFGCVKVAERAVSGVTGMLLGTVIGKPGYAPPEQIRYGQAYASSDLYSLAVTVLVLLSGKDPGDLYNSNQATWQWRPSITVSSALGKILDKMLAHNPTARYQSAKEVLQALEDRKISAVNNIISRVRTFVVAPGNNQTAAPNENQNSAASSRLNSAFSRIKTLMVGIAHNQTSVSSSNNNRGLRRRWRVAVISAIALISPGIVTFALVRAFKPKSPPNLNPPEEISLKKREADRRKKILQRLKELNLNEGSFFDKVDRLFYQQYPQFKNNPLTDKPEDKKFREKWYEIAEDLLKQQ